MSNYSSERQLFYGALLPSLAISLCAVVIFALIGGSHSLLGALLGCLTVIIFFSVHLVINAITKNLDPIATMALAMFSYFAKVLIMGAFLILITKFTAPETVNRAAFAITALAITAVWLGGEIRAFFKLRVSLPLPQTGTTQHHSSDGGDDGAKQ